MKTLCTHSLPKEKMPYLLRSGEGERYLFGRQVATVMANGGAQVICLRSCFFPGKRRCLSASRPQGHT